MKLKIITPQIEAVTKMGMATAEEKQWFDGITDVDLVAFNENNNTLKRQ